MHSIFTLTRFLCVVRFVCPRLVLRDLTYYDCQRTTAHCHARADAAATDKELAEKSHDRQWSVVSCIMVAGLGDVVADSLSDAQHPINLG